MGGGIVAAIGGALAGAVAGGLSFGVIHAGILWCIRGGGGSALFQPYNIKLGFQLGAGLGMTVGAVSWFFPGLVRAARRLPFPWRRLTRTVMAGALIGTAVMALNSSLYLVYLARAGGAGNRTTVQFLQTGSLPGKIGPVPSTEFPMLVMFIGLMLGIAAGTWWGLRPSGSLRLNKLNHPSQGFKDEKVAFVGEHG